MAITLQDYEKWLENDTADRAFLVLITGYNPNLVQEETFYFSTKPFQTSPADSLPNIQFFPYLQQEPTFARSGNFYGDSIGNDDFGTVAIDSLNGEFDFFINYLWRNRKILILLGDTSWSYDDFLVKPFVQGVIDDKPDFSKESITFNVLDKTGKLDRELEEDLIGTGSSNENILIPNAFGYVRNAKPVLIDKVNQTYKWNNGSVASLDNVYDKGLPLSLGAGYSADNANGEFTLVYRPAGDITIDGTGANITTTRNLVQLIAEKEFSYPTDFNVPSLDALDIAKPYPIGFYTDIERFNCLDIIEDLLTSLGCFFFIDFDGKFSIGILKEPLGETPSVYLNEVNNIYISTLEIESLNWFQYRTFIDYAKCWYVQSYSDLSELVEEASVDFYDFVSNEYRRQEFTDNSVIPLGTEKWAAKSPEAIKTFILNESDALTEAQYVQGILGKQRFKCSFDANSTIGSIIPGNFINVAFNRYGMENGINMQVLSTSYIQNNKTKVIAWY